MDESNPPVKGNDYDTEIKLFLNQKRVYDKIFAERKNEINTLNSNDKLKYQFKSENKIPISFNSFNCSLGLTRNINNGSIEQEKAKENQKQSTPDLSEITRGEWDQKSEDQKNTTNNFKMFYKAREKVITLFGCYTSIVSKTKYEAKHEKGLKISTPKQMLQRLPIALAQLKTKTYYIKSDKLLILYIEQNKLIKKYITV